MSAKAKATTKDRPRSVVLTSIRVSDVPRLEKIADCLGMKKVEFLSRVLDRYESRTPAEMFDELLSAGK